MCEILGRAERRLRVLASGGVTGGGGLEENDETRETRV